MDSSKIVKTILLKLDRLGYWGGRHTSIENLTHGFPSHLKKEVKIVLKNLIRSGYLLTKPKPDSLHVSLNPRYTKEILRLIESKNINSRFKK